MLRKPIPLIKQTSLLVLVVSVVLALFKLTYALAFLLGYVSYLGYLLVIKAYVTHLLEVEAKGWLVYLAFIVINCFLLLPLALSLVLKLNVLITFMGIVTYKIVVYSFNILKINY